MIPGTGMQQKLHNPLSLPDKSASLTSKRSLPAPGINQSGKKACHGAGRHSNGSLSARPRETRLQTFTKTNRSIVQIQIGEENRVELSRKSLVCRHPSP